MFRELVEHQASNRGHIVDAGSIFPTPAAYTRYCSMFMFGTDMQTHITITKSVSDYKGRVFADAIWIDIDADGKVHEAQAATINLIKRLNTEYQVNPDHLPTYFSGRKGFHVAILCPLIGFKQSDAVEPEKVKDFVRRISAGIPHIDFVIYEAVRLFRIENSRHEKTGLYKVRLSFSELQCHIDDILTLAKAPRVFPYKPDPNGFEVKPGLAAVWQNSGAYVQEVREAEGNTHFFSAPKQGNRNNQLLKQAAVLFRKSELSNNAILDIIRNAAELSSIGSTDPITEQETRRIVSQAEKLVGDERKKAETSELQMKSFGEWIPEWERYTLQEQTKFTLGFSDINRIMRGRLKGKLGVIMGYGGAKKSLYALNLLLSNLNENGDVGIYSTMEMSVPQLINRVIDHECKYERANASLVVERLYRKSLEEGRKFLVDQLGGTLGNRLQIVSNARMTYPIYKEAVRVCRETAGPPFMLVVDGLSMMGGKGSETEVYSNNTADLKQLANEENIFVLLICHVSKGGEKYTRDLSRLIRGSEKILDNCDFYMTLSQIQNEDNPETYRKDLGFINFCDKRGSGEVVDVVYGFDPYQLKMFETSESPSMYYEPVKKRAVKEENQF